MDNPLSGFTTPDLPLAERILLGAFVFSIIGLFTIVGIVKPGVGWFLYVFLIPFWAMFPLVIVGVKGALTLLGIYMVGFPTAKLLLSRSVWNKKQIAANGRQRGGRSTFGGRNHSSGSWSSSSSNSTGSFSGSGGSSGGGGSSGSW